MREAFCSNPVARDEIREYLNPIYDWSVCWER